MEDTWVRINSLLPPFKFHEMQLHSRSFALLCVAPGCDHCATFETEHVDEAERLLKKYNVKKLYTWVCSGDASSTAQRSGVENVPSIIIIPRKGKTIQIFDAFSFIS